MSCRRLDTSSKVLENGIAFAELQLPVWIVLVAPLGHPKLLAWRGYLIASPSILNAGLISYSLINGIFESQDCVSKQHAVHTLRKIGQTQRLFALWSRRII